MHEVVDEQILVVLHVVVIDDEIDVHVVRERRETLLLVVADEAEVEPADEIEQMV